MLTTAYYFLQVILCSAVMMGYYWLVLRNKRFHQYNRFYLLSIAVLSWIVPLIKIKWGHTDTVINNQPQVFQFLNVLAYHNSQIEERISQESHVFHWEMFAGGAYCLIAGILLLAMSHALLRVYRLLKTHECKSAGDVYLILTRAKGTPFSFFRYIFWNEDIDMSSETGQQIMRHELTHVQEKHSFDKLLIQVVLVAGWFNPFFWLIRKELDMIHEFIADRKAVHNGDSASLAQMLLTAAYPQQQYLLTNPFFFSPVKRRLQMLTNNQNPSFSYVRRLIVLPLLAMVVILFAFRDKEQKEHTLSVASVVEGVVEKGRQLLLVQDIQMPTEKQLQKNLFQAVDPVLLKRAGALNSSDYSLFYNDHTISLTNSTIFNSLVSEQNEKITKIYSPDTIKPHLGLNYQAIARDPYNNIAKNRKVFVRIGVLHGSAYGDKVWEETHETTTNDEGIFSIVIGQGKRLSGIVKTDINQIDWNDGPYFLNTKLAVVPSIPVSWWVASDNYQDAGTIQLHGIPYELWKDEPKGVAGDPKSFNRHLDVSAGVDVTVPANTTTVANIVIPGIKKGDPILVSPQVDSRQWSIYSAWVADDNQVKVRFANYTDKSLNLLGTDYKVVVIK